MRFILRLELDIPEPARPDLLPKVIRLNRERSLELLAMVNLQDDR